MTRIIALALASVLGASVAFAGNLEPVAVEPAPAAPVATGSMGQKAALIGLGALALGGVIWAIADDDDDDDNTPDSTSGS